MTDNDRLALNARAHFILTGDDGGCWDKSGSVTGEVGHEIEQRCLNAIGAGYQGAGSFVINEKPLTFNSYREAMASCPYGWTSYSTFLWLERVGQPWQADIEAHVRAYREPAPDYAGDIGEAMKLVEHAKSLGWALHLHNDTLPGENWWMARFRNIVVPSAAITAKGDTAAESVAVGYVAAMSTP